MNIPKFRQALGFTLIESAVVVGIIAITLSVGLPSFQTTITTNHLNASANDLVTALQMARSESIKRVRFAGVAYNDAGNWAAVVVGTPNQVLQTYAAADDVTLTIASGTVNGGDLIVRYRPDGRISSSTPVVMELGIAGKADKQIITVQPSGAVNRVVL